MIQKPSFNDTQCFRALRLQLNTIIPESVCGCQRSFLAENCDKRKIVSYIKRAVKALPFTLNMVEAVREASTCMAVTMAEYYRDGGYREIFLVGSLLHWVEALREISASLEEMPGEEGYSTSLAS